VDGEGQDLGFLYTRSTYTMIDPPGSTETFAQSINDSGQITGYYVDGEGQDLGFLYTRSTYTMIDPPGSTETFAQSINDRGQVTGFFLWGNSPGQEDGFVYSHGSYTMIDPPGSVLYRPAKHQQLRGGHRILHRQQWPVSRLSLQQR
jgi:uncharacterized membrane protein